MAAQPRYAWDTAEVMPRKPSRLHSLGLTAALLILLAGLALDLHLSKRNKRRNYIDG